MDSEKNESKQKISTGKKIGLGCLGLFGLGILIIIITVIASCGNASKETSLKSASNSSNKNTNSESAKVYKIGDEIQANDRTITVTNVNKNYSSGNQFDKPQDSNNNYIVIDIAIANISSNELPISDYDFKLEDGTGTQRNVTIGGLVDGRLQSVTLSKDGKTSGKLIFEAKKNSSVLKLHYRGGLFSNNDVIIEL